jgi:hypothetical protein
MSEGPWYVDAESGPSELEDESVYDEALGPVDPHVHGGPLLVEDDEGAHPDTTSEAVAHEAFARRRELSAEESAMHVVENPY